MGLTLPSGEDLAAHREGFSDTAALQYAADLLTLATGLITTPTDPLAARLVTTAILDMAWYLQVHHDDREAEFSPFSSERIGSYSYSKMAAAAQSKTDTGVAGFDAAVAYLNGLTADAIFAMDTEWVFTKGFERGRVFCDLDVNGNPILEIEG